MDKETLKALKGSIKKWEKIVARKGVDLGVDNCPLCQKFFSEDEMCCSGCPVSDETGMSGCEGTPYEECKTHNRHPENFTDEDIAGAKRELAFLKSLLPK